jgi:chemotaxis protein MotB
MADEDYQEEEIPPEAAEAGSERPELEDPPSSAPLWMVSYGDMMSLMLGFFILLHTFSTMDVIKYRQLVGSLQSAFGSQNTQALPPVISGRETVSGFGKSQAGEGAMMEQDLEDQLVAAVQEEGLTGEATLARTDRGLVLRVRERIAFEPGSATLNPRSLPLLRKVALVCRVFPRKIYVEGHTDIIPVRSEIYASNWELSAARAGSVVRFLLDAEHLAPEQFVASGLAATVPIAPNNTEEGRARNRRVEFVFSGRPGGEDAEE